MPLRKPSPDAEEFFYFEDHQRNDADLHDQILADGDHHAALAVGRAVMRRLGLTDQQIAEVSKSVARRDFDESKHPRDDGGRWTDGGGEGDSGGSTSDGPYHTLPEFHPGLKAVNDPGTVKAFKDKWVEQSPNKTLDAVLAAAPKMQAELGAVGRSLAAKLHVEFKDPGVKTKSARGIERTKVKIEQRGGNAARVTDVVRASFVVDKPAQSDVIAAELGKHFEVTLENWRETPVHYLDRAAIIRGPNGMLGEIQFMDAKMANAKSDKGGNGHGLYVQWRALDPKSPAAITLFDKMSSLYNKVIDGYSADWKAVVGRAAT